MINYPSINDKPRIDSRRYAFLYLEQGNISRTDSALEFISAQYGKVNIPIASIAALMLGPGTTITHKAVELTSEMGVSIMWVGQDGVRYYASGHPLTNNSSFIIRQAELVSDKKKRLQVVKHMYQMRFPDEVISGDTLAQLRGKEGARVKQAYRDNAEKHGLEWRKRVSRMHSISPHDYLNQAVTMATSSLYGISSAAITAIGASTSLGFIHTGHINSFTFDITDLYKTEIAVPVACEIVANHDIDKNNLDFAIRDRMRKEFREQKIIARIIKDIKELFSIKETNEELFDISKDRLYLWDIHALMEGNINYDYS